jgi:hypothetical protein
MNKVFEKYLNNNDTNNDINNNTNNEKIFEKEKYVKFYNLVITVIIFFILNTYETLIKSTDEFVLEFDLDTINQKLSNIDNTQQILKIQLNIYWIEFNKKKNNKDQLIIDFEDLIKIDIIKHKICLFKYIKNMCIYLIDKISQLKLENLKNHNEFKDKIGAFANSILLIDKMSGLEDEDDFDCIDCNYNVTEANDEFFWY